MIKRLRQLNPGATLVHIFRYAIIAMSARIFFMIFYGFRVYGLKNVPKTGALVIISNHQSFFDPPFVSCSLNRQMYFLARSSLFKNRIFETIIKSVNAIPLHGNQRDTAVFKACEYHLNKGRMVLVFPEGSRSEDGRINEFKRGTLLLLRRSKAAVLPVAVAGGFENWSPHEPRPHMRGPIHANFGKVIPSEKILSLKPDEALEMLRNTVNDLYLDLRNKMRTETNNAFPPISPADTQ